MVEKTTIQNGYSEVNGIQMYYEIYGQGSPLVLIHGGGSTIQTTFERVIPLLAQHRKIIAVELQAHGRTNDRNTDSSFEQDADDVAQLLENLHIEKADFFGFSNGATTALQIAIRHPTIVNKLVLASILTKRHGIPEQFWTFMQNASLDNMPVQLKEAYLAVNNNLDGLLIMHERDANRMRHFQDIPDELISSVIAPVLIINGDKDIITNEHALEMNRLLPNSRLAIIPGVHGEYIDEITTIKPNGKGHGYVVEMIEDFLDA